MSLAEVGDIFSSLKSYELRRFQEKRQVVQVLEIYPTGETGQHDLTQNFCVCEIKRESNFCHSFEYHFAPGYKTAMSLSRLAQLIHELVAKIGPVVPVLNPIMPPAQEKSLLNLPLSWRPGQSFRIDQLSKSAEDMVATEKEEKRKHARQQLADSYLEDTGQVMPLGEIERVMRDIEKKRMDSCKEYEFVEESVKDEYLLVDQHIRELQYHDLRYMKNQVDALYRLTNRPLIYD